MAYVPRVQKYKAPTWPRLPIKAPSRKINGLAAVPTPVQSINASDLLDGAAIKISIKRDDIIGFGLSGNKVRKLEFLLADALAQGCDCVVTAGGQQSNHCRATAVACRRLGTQLQPHLVLRTPHESFAELGLQGNLLLDQLVGAQIWLVHPDEYVARGGGNVIVESVADKLRQEGRKPYVIPVGGSNGLGTWGYLEAVSEIRAQCAPPSALADVSDIAVACGSGGTAAGLALGVYLSGMPCKVHAFCVCDSPEVFYRELDQDILGPMFAGSSVDPPRAEDILSIYNSTGAGYAVSRPTELSLLRRVAETSGIILDPVYTGKAFHGLCQLVRERPERLRGSHVLFVHTGGGFGAFSFAAEFEACLREVRAPVRRVTDLPTNASSKL